MVTNRGGINCVTHRDHKFLTNEWHVEVTVKTLKQILTSVNLKASTSIPVRARMANTACRVVATYKASFFPLLLSLLLQPVLVRLKL